MVQQLSYTHSENIYLVQNHGRNEVMVPAKNMGTLLLSMRGLWRNYVRVPSITLIGQLISQLPFGTRYICVFPQLQSIDLLLTHQTIYMSDEDLEAPVKSLRQSCEYYSENSSGVRSQNLCALFAVSTTGLRIYLVLQRPKVGRQHESIHISSALMGQAHTQNQGDV